MPSLVWTRAREDWERDRGLFERGRWPLLRLPCLRTARRAETKLPEAPYYVFTSVKAARFALEDSRSAALVRKATRCFTHGIKTADLLAREGCAVEHLEVETAERLAAALAQKLPKGARVVQPGPQKPAFDLVGYLVGQGFAAQGSVLYETVTGLWNDQGEDLTVEEIAHLGGTLAGAVCFASPSAVEGFTEGFSSHENRLSTALRAICLGPTTREAARPHFQRIFTPVSQTLPSLVEKARQSLLTL